MGRKLTWMLGASLAVAGVAATAGACGSFGSSSDGGDAGPAAEGGPAAGEGGVGEGGVVADDDGGVTDLGLCDPTKSFHAPQAFPAVIDGSSNEYAGFLSSAKTLYLASDRGGRVEIYRSTRELPFGNRWSMPTVVSELSTSGDDARNPNLAPDELGIYFDSTRGGGKVPHVYFATRASTTEAFGAPVLIPLDGSRYNLQPWIATRGLYFASRAPGGPLSIWFASGKAGVFSQPVELVELEAPGEVQSPVLTEDELTIFFTGGPAPGNLDVYMAKRASVFAGFSSPVLVSELSTAGDDYPTWVSKNGCAAIVEVGQGSNADLLYAVRGL